MSNDCLFCKIIAREIPATIVHQNHHVTAFRDINPVAPTHILIVPNRHISAINAIETEHTSEVFALFQVANQLAVTEKIDDSGYRLVINNGRDAGQAVFHLHVHLLGGRALDWPPG